MRQAATLRITIIIVTMMYVQTSVSNDECLVSLSKPPILVLYLAITNDNVKMTELLLESGANIEWMKLAKNSHTQEIESSPSTIDATRSSATELLIINNITPLMLAIEKASIEIVELIANRPETDVNLKFTGKMITIGEITPLTLAIKKGKADVVRLLSNHPGIDINLMTYTYNSLGYTPLMVAAKKGDTKIFDILLENPEIIDVVYENILATHTEKEGKAALGPTILKEYIKKTAPTISDDLEMDVALLKHLEYILSKVYYIEKKMIRRRN